MSDRELNELRWTRALREVEALEDLYARPAYTTSKRDWASLFAWAVIVWLTLSVLTIFGLGLERVLGWIF